PEEAQHFINQYFDRYSGVKVWNEKTLEEVRQKGWVGTLAGRRRPVRDINSENGTLRGFAERIAINTPIQGSSADIIKAAMIHISLSLSKRKSKCKMLVQVHDELLFEVPNDELQETISLIRTEMESAYKLKIPLVVDIKIGPNWNDMEPFKGEKLV
ncbi:hypothetical protein BVX98_00730, partial [bacterium F11]